MKIKEFFKSLFNQSTPDESGKDCSIKEQNDENDSTLLYDGDLVKLFGKCVSLIDKLEEMSQGFKSAKEQFLINMVQDELFNALLLSGGTIIDKDESFDIIRHKCVNKVDAKNGMVIEQTVKPGLKLGDRVYIRANVNVKI